MPLVIQTDLQGEELLRKNDSIRMPYEKLSTILQEIAVKQRSP